NAHSRIDRLTFREVLLRLASAKGKPLHFFPVPSTVVLFGLQTLERMGVKSCLRSDSLISLLNQNTQVDFSGLHMLEKQGCFFRETLGFNESRRRSISS
ncbi:MAG TPA: hypothetical protein VHV10_12690, partial [Ktedonobacteraceae bacterium]|nr:hypothetical protein [Ktedonobacteraceae bacterium]